jgi:hypothetical protein
MDKILNLIIIIILLVFGYMVLNKKENNTLVNNTLVNNQSDDLYKEENYDYLDEIFNDIEYKKNPNEISVITLKKKSIDIKPYFVDMRVHNDYRDTITSFNNIAPDMRPMFNRSVLPVKQIDVDPKQVKPLVKAFIKRVNEDVKYNVSDELKANSGWDELAPEKKDKDGWKKQMDELGLPDDLYLSPAKRAKVKLLKIDAVQKFATEEQLNFVVHMIIQKKNATDQLIVKVSYVLDNVDMNIDRNFNKNSVTMDMNVKIEDIYVIGFLTDHQYGDTTDRKDFYEFNNIEKDDMIDPELVLKELTNKYKQRQIDSDGFNVNISPQKMNNEAIFRLSSETPYKPFDHTNKFC